MKKVLDRNPRVITLVSLAMRPKAVEIPSVVVPLDGHDFKGQPLSAFPEFCIVHYVYY